MIPIVQPASSSNVVGAQRFVALPADFAIHFTDAVADTSLRLTFGSREIPTNFYVENVLTGARADFMIVEDVDSLRNGRYDDGDRIILVMGETPGTAPEFSGGRWLSSWSIRLAPPDPEIDTGIPYRPPAAGSVLHFGTEKPFQTGDRVSFTLSAPGYDEEAAKGLLDDVIVVPNPYVATSSFEPANTYRAGRGERRIYFMNLPAECTIRIYTITGQLVQTLHHASSIDDGQEPWDLVTKDGMNAAFGVYVYHVDAPGIGEHVGRFAVIK